MLLLLCMSSQLESVFIYFIQVLGTLHINRHGYCVNVPHLVSKALEYKTLFAFQSVPWWCRVRVSLDVLVSATVLHGVGQCG